MRAFDPDAVLSEQPERVDGALAEALGRAIARFHAGAAVRPDCGGTRALGFTIRTNAENLRRLAPELGEAEVERLIAATDTAFAAAGASLDRRATAGFARRCHGDLHLGNILLEDVQYDVAFTVMDLWFRRRDEAANRLMNAYLDESARSFPPDLWDGLAALPLMLSARAAVRTHVTGAQGDVGSARAYLAAALAHLSPPPPALIAIGGLSGTGKSTLARRVAPSLGHAPGAVVLRSDEIRKRLAGVGPTERLPDESYTARSSAQVYDEMLRVGRATLDAGHSVVLDAVFLGPQERDAAEALAAAAGVPFGGFWLEGRADVLRGRLAARGPDASDAGPEVLDEQLARGPGDIGWLRLDAGDPEDAARRVIAGAEN
jgi:hypothetical protein